VPIYYSPPYTSSRDDLDAPARPTTDTRIISPVKVIPGAY
jgi:hypothetical protein